MLCWPEASIRSILAFIPPLRPPPAPVCQPKTHGRSSHTAHQTDGTIHRTPGKPRGEQVSTPGAALLCVVSTSPAHASVASLRLVQKLVRVHPLGRVAPPALCSFAPARSVYRPTGWRTCCRCQAALGVRGALLLQCYFTPKGLGTLLPLRGPAIAWLADSTLAPANLPWPGRPAGGTGTPRAPRPCARDMLAEAHTSAGPSRQMDAGGASHDGVSAEDATLSKMATTLSSNSFTCGRRVCLLPRVAPQPRLRAPRQLNQLTVWS